MLALSGPGELIDSVPYLLGFHPSDSVVLVGLRLGPTGRARVGISARVDLADLAVDGAILDRCIEALARSQASRAVVLVYDGETDRIPAELAGWLPWRSVIDDIGDRLADAGLALHDAVLVGGARWWSYLCRDPACCPVDGTPRHAPDSPAAAAAVYAGLGALPSRSALEALLEPEPSAGDPRRRELIEAAERADVEATLDGRGDALRRSAVRALFAAARAHTADRPAPARLPDAQLARFASALRTTAVRDACWMAVDAGRLPDSDLWRTLARRLPAPYDAAPLILLGWQEWRAGNGVMAGMAAARARASDPDCTAAQLLLDALAHGLDPGRTPRLRGRSARRRAR